MAPMILLNLFITSFTEKFVISDLGKAFQEFPPSSMRKLIEGVSWSLLMIHCSYCPRLEKNRN